jgi:nucleoside-diphosphate-sugar epimerase
VRALVIGGTGPTGHFIVNGLRARGFAVTIFHTGRHEVPEIPSDVEHIHADPFAPGSLETALDGRSFEVCIATYGRLRRVAEAMVGRCARFLSIGGVPAYRGFMNPALFSPAGLPVPLREDAAKVEREGEDAKGFRIARTEEAVFAAQPEATHFRYPYVYGPYQLVPREWCIVRRILDRRPFIVLPEDGLTLHHYGYAENLAHAVLLALDRPERALGQVYHCADDEVLTLRQVVEIVVSALGASLEIVSMPWQLAVPARPLLAQPLPTHRVFDLAKIRDELGYRDVVAPREALGRTARWLVEHPPAPGGQEETVLQDPFDYPAEDRLVAAWKAALVALPEVKWSKPPGYTLSYSGPGGRARSSADFDG